MKKNSNLILWLTRLSWGTIILNLLFILIGPFLFGDLQLSDSFAASIPYWLIISSIVACTCLIIRYRTFFRTWAGWTTPILLLIICTPFVEKVIPVNNCSHSFFFIVLCKISICSVCLATAILLCYRDVGLELIAWGSAIFIWIMALGWYFQGNLIELHFVSPSSLWWMMPFIYVAELIIPLGFISFTVHTIKLIIQEVKKSEAYAQDTEETWIVKKHRFLPSISLPWHLCTPVFLFSSVSAGLIAAFLTIRTPVILINIILITGLIFAGFTITSILLAWRANRFSQDYHSAPECQVRYHGLSFLLWFISHNLFWAAGTCLSAAFLLKIFGPRTWVAAYCAGALACSFYTVSGILFARKTETLGLCWQSTVPDGISWLLPRFGATIVLNDRYRHAVEHDNQSEFLLREITSLLDLARTGSAERPVNIQKSESTSLKRETINRFKVLGVLFVMVVLLFVPIAGTFGLPDTEIPPVISMLNPDKDPFTRTQPEEDKTDSKSGDSRNTGIEQNVSNQTGNDQNQDNSQNRELNQNDRKYSESGKTDKNQGGHSSENSQNGKQGQNQSKGKQGSNNQGNKPHDSKGNKEGGQDRTGGNSGKMNQQKGNNKKESDQGKNHDMGQKGKQGSNDQNQSKGKQSSGAQDGNGQDSGDNKGKQAKTGDSQLSEKSSNMNQQEQARKSGNQSRKKQGKNNPDDKQNDKNQGKSCAGTQKGKQGGSSQDQAQGKQKREDQGSKKSGENKQKPQDSDQQNKGGQGCQKYSATGTPPKLSLSPPSLPLPRPGKKRVIKLDLPSLTPVYGNEAGTKTKEDKTPNVYPTEPAANNEPDRTVDKTEKPVQYLPNWIITIFENKNKSE
ncbi:MAG: hypothetical protein GY749_38475 [Desulfobacteraceae bacterium]|nr:hypothetical protein [Desulfobacteraceae bacterium]